MIYIVELNGKKYGIELSDSSVAIVEKSDMVNSFLEEDDIPDFLFEGEDSDSNNEIEAPMTGTVLSIKYSKGDYVEEGDILLTIESMKMENDILALHSGKIENIYVDEGDKVEKGRVLLKFYEEL